MKNPDDLKYKEDLNKRLETLKEILQTLEDGVAKLYGAGFPDMFQDPQLMSLGATIGRIKNDQGGIEDIKRVLERIG